VIVRLARGEEELAQALRLREEVFCGEQGVALAAEQDGRDGEALHVVALEGHVLVGTCRLLFDGPVARLGRLAVVSQSRRRGVGRRILDAAEEIAAQAGADRIALHAQTAAERLYADTGYVRRGEPFVQEDIEHVAMEKTLVRA
jgi:predicted GNAT family N-acyltransferase